MSIEQDPLTELLDDPSFRQVLEQLRQQLRVATPTEVLLAALSIIALASQERDKGARLLLHYPNGDYNEMVYWNSPGPRLIAKDGHRLDVG